MEVASLSACFNAGEHNCRVINVTLDKAAEGKSLRLAFITPKGRRFMSGNLEVSELKASYEVPSELLDGRGKLFVQAVVYENGEFIAKSRVESFYVDGSLDDWDFTENGGLVSPESIADSIDELREENLSSQERISSLEESCFAIETALEEEFMRKTDSPPLVTSLKGKIWVAVGDGQTEENAYKTAPYTETVRAAFGISQVLNYGENGSSISKKNSSDIAAMCERAQSLPADADLITVFGGGEDMRSGIPLGTLGDSDDETFYGGMEKLCRTLLTMYTGKTVVFITPTQQDKLFSVNALGLTAADYADAMKKACRKYSIPVYDANGESAICTSVEEQKNFCTSDGLYLNDAGHALLANGLFNFIRSLSTVRTSFAEDGSPQPTVTAKSVRLNKSSVTVKSTGSTKIIAVVSPSNAVNKEVTWSASPEGLTLTPNGSSCTVSGNGGDYILTCTTVDGGHTASCAVTVTVPYVAVRSVSLDCGSAEITVGNTFPIRATVSPSNATDSTVSWSTDSDCVTLEPSGKICSVYGVSEGTATVTCSASDGSLSASCTVTVNPAAVAPTAIRFSEASVSVRQAVSKTLYVYFTPTDAASQGLVFTAENDNVTLEADGSSVTVTGVNTGTCVVTATTEDGALTSSCTVTVLAAVT